jgi:hypothetical protein
MIIVNKYCLVIQALYHASPARAVDRKYKSHNTRKLHIMAFVVDKTTLLRLNTKTIEQSHMWIV